MEVVNVKVKYIRPKYENLKEWMNDPNNKYIGRAGIVFIDGERFPKKSSTWANPFKLTGDDSRDAVLQKYTEYISERLRNEPKLRKKLLNLKGKKLGCWCYPEPCHGDVLISLIDSFS